MTLPQQTLAYESSPQMVVRPHEDGSVSIDVPALGLLRFFRVKTRGGLVALWTWCILCALAPVAGGIYFAMHGNQDAWIFVALAPVAIVFVFLILWGVTVVIGGTQAYFRASPTELTITTRNRLTGETTVHIPADEVISLFVGKQREMEVSLCVQRARYDTQQIYLQQYAPEQIREVAMHLAAVLKLDEVTVTKGWGEGGEKWERRSRK